MRFQFVGVVLKCLNIATFWKNLLVSLVHDFAPHSVAET